MMRDFELLENEHDHTGGPRQGPLAAFSKMFRGRDYFHIRRVYRDAHDMWAATGNGISCPLDQREAMLTVLSNYLEIPASMRIKPNGKTAETVAAQG